jgi:multidrug resistance efflux pump
MATNTEGGTVEGNAETGSRATQLRWRWMSAAVVGFLTVGSAYGVHWADEWRFRRSTDDAYVNGNFVQVTPQISGTVVSIGADDTQYVKAGQLLVKLDPTDAQVAIDRTEAGLARTVREVRFLYATPRNCWRPWSCALQSSRAPGRTSNGASSSGSLGRFPLRTCSTPATK